MLSSFYSDTLSNFCFGILTYIYMIFNVSNSVLSKGCFLVTHLNPLAVFLFFSLIFKENIKTAF